MGQRAKVSSNEAPQVVDLEATDFRVASAVAGPGYILVHKDTGESSFWLASSKPTPDATIRYGSSYLSFVSDVVATNKVKKEGLKDDLFFLWSTNDIHFSGGAWVETGRYAGTVNNSQGRYFTREAVAEVTYSANREGIDPAVLARHLEATMDPVSARHWKGLLGVGEPLAEASAKPTGLRQAVGPALDRLSHELRDEWRLKLGTDYALVSKYGRTHLLCSEVFLETIQECAAKHGVAFASVSLCERLQGGTPETN